jgi:hypothetical protein
MGRMVSAAESGVGGAVERTAAVARHGLRQRGAPAVLAQSGTPAVPNGRVGATTGGGRGVRRRREKTAVRATLPLEVV